MLRSAPLLAGVAPDADYLIPASLDPLPSGRLLVRERQAAYGAASAGERTGPIGSELRESSTASSASEGRRAPTHGSPTAPAVEPPHAKGSAAPGAEPEVVPDPFDDADALGELEHELTSLAAHIAAATHRFLLLLAEFDRRRGWELGGHRSCAHWLHVATALDLRTARSRVRVAGALVRLPETSEAMRRGELSFSQVRALSRVATPECETELIEYAKSTTVADLERFVRMWRTLSRADDEAVERARHRSRRFSVVPDGEGMYAVRGRVPPEVGAVLMRAIEAAGDALFASEAKEETTARQRRADALGLVVERALSAGFGHGSNGSREPRAEDEDESSEPGSREPRAESDAEGLETGSREPSERSDGETGGAPAGGNDPGRDGAPIPLSGTRAERYQVMLHVKAEGAHLEDGTGLASATARRLCCDSSVVTVPRKPDGSILDVGRRTRSIPGALRRALEVRDGGCRFPGCGLRFTDGHHLEHWADGGETRLDNLVLLCRYHHRLVHEGSWRVELWGKEEHAAFIDPRGGIHMDRSWPRAPDRLHDRDGASDDRPELPEAGSERPAPGLPDDAVESLIAGNESTGIRPSGWALWAEHARPADVPWALRARAVEALDAAHFGV